MLTLYTRPNCPLCEEAKLMLTLIQEDFPVEYGEVNIEEDDRLHEKYMLMIPVLEKDGKVLIYGNLGYAEILEALGY
ncbi:glutaredoxin family protein [Planococcus sp. MERTA32b]|nr:glutaredoxin family protein [Planococcus sp. MER TA 32b]